MPVLDDGVVEVSAETGLDVGHVLHLGDAPHRDLLPLILVCHWGTHFVPSLICNIKSSLRRLEFRIC